MSDYLISDDSYWDNCFMINGVAMPKPDSWETVWQDMLRDADREIDTARMNIDHITCVYISNWTYSYSEYSRISELITEIVDNMDKHKSQLTVASPNTLKPGYIVCYPAYPPSELKLPLKRIDPIDGKHYYDNFTISLIGAGGLEETTNYHIKKDVFQKKEQGTMNYSNYDELIRAEYVFATKEE